MNERQAKKIVLVRAIETIDGEQAILSADDRRIASHSARERLATAAGDPELAGQAVPAQFLAIRAELLFNRVLRRHPALETLIDRSRQMALAAFLVPFLAFVVGIAVDRIVDPHRVDLLSAPLLGLLAWNLAVYAGMLVWWCLRTMGAKPRRDTGGLAHWLRAGSNRLLQDLPLTLHAALVSFAIEWRRLSSTLDAARIGRTLHLSAALFATGAVLSLYIRGVLTQYAAGWESTFLGPAQLQAILSTIFAPARTMLQLPAFSLGDIEALRFATGGTVVAAGSGARWVHLYAATLLLLVILPRLLLAGLAHWRARRVRRDFPLSLAHPYFRRLLSELGGAAGVMQVLPYSFTLDAARSQSLEQIAAMLLGERAQVVVDASTDYGAEPIGPASVVPGDAVTIMAVLFNLAATPEPQNHGAFLEQIRQRTSAAGCQLLVLVDESGYRMRVDDQSGGAARLAERSVLWQEFCLQHHLRATMIDLVAPQRHRLNLDTAIHTGGKG